MPWLGGSNIAFLFFCIDLWGNAVPNVCFVFCCFYRIMDGSVASSEEILPPTIQKLMKGYNKYLRPFFDSTTYKAFTFTLTQTIILHKWILSSLKSYHHQQLQLKLN